MNPETIIKLVHKTGAHKLYYEDPEAMFRLVAEVEAHMKERCAKVADRFHVPMSDTATDIIATEIRAME